MESGCNSPEPRDFQDTGNAANCPQCRSRGRPCPRAPLVGYRDFGGRRVASEGKAIWHHPDRDFTYGEFTVLKLEYNVAAPTR